MKSSIRVSRTRLPNGVRVVTARLAHLASSHVAIMHRGGPVHEDDGTWGLSHLVEHMVFRGTGRHKDTRAVSLAADRFGGEIDGATWRDRIVYDTRVDAGREREAIALIAEMLLAPRFEGLGVEKDVLREELLESINDEGIEIDADNVAARRLFDGHVLARTIEGTLETLDGFDKRAVRRFHKELVGPAHLVVAVAGPTSHAAVVDATRRTFGRWQGENGIRPGTPPQRLKKRGVAEVVRDEASAQTQLRLSFPCVGLFDAERYATAMLGRILDDGPAARFRSRLIDEEGLAYSLWCDVDLYEDRGAFEIGAQVTHERVGEVVAAICRELAVVKRRSPPAAELRRVTARVERDLLDMRDLPGQVAESAARGELVGLPLDPAHTLARVRALKPADIKRAADRVLVPERSALILVGLPPRREVQKAVVAIGDLLQ